MSIRRLYQACRRGTTIAFTTGAAGVSPRITYCWRCGGTDPRGWVHTCPGERR
jgi:hypothetical protein